MHIIETLEEVGGIIHDSHLVLKSGRHGTDYVNFDFLFPHPLRMWELAEEIVQCEAMEDVPEAIVGPAVGGVALVTWVAAYLSQIYSEPFLMFWADKDVNGNFVLERGTWGRQIKGRKTVAIEDVVTTTGSIAGTVKAAQSDGAEVVLVIICVNRTGKNDEELAELIGAPEVYSLSGVDYPSYAPEDCPACAANVPIVTDVGHGAEFQKDYPDYPGDFTTLLDK